MSKVTYQRIEKVVARIVEQCETKPNDAGAFADVLPVSQPDAQGVSDWLHTAMLKAAANAEYADDLAACLDAGLEDLAASDFFGTERQMDPRGDGRNGQWSMFNVEGVDSV